jgi:beta-1,2-mannobiose phosphorylase / 1,2-beta-oligomannan phosphorylase
MLPRLFNACLLRPKDVPPSQEGMTVLGVFNPGAVATDDGVVLMLRVAEAALEKRAGFTALPRWDLSTGRIAVDWAPDTEVERVDARVIKNKKTGIARLNFISHLRVARSRDGRTIDSLDEPIFQPMNKYEEFGLEDPRITRIEDKFYVTYVAVSRHGVATALVSTRDFRSFERHGIIYYPENKDVVLFPEKIGGLYFALHRPTTATPFAKPEMWIATSTDVTHWGGHERFLGGGRVWDLGRVGAGTPPIRTARGWLAIYHGNNRREGDLSIGAYSGGALLMDLENPRRIVGASGQIFRPELEFERLGYIPEVVFPTGIVEQGDTVLVYYGAADTCSAVVEFAVKDLLGSILPLSGVESATP